jgi:hypothetical protein
MSDKIIDLGAHTNMTPDEAFAVAQRRPWEQVMIIGFTEDSRGIVCFSSHMAREKALWIIEHAKLHAMDML